MGSATRRSTKASGILGFSGTEPGQKSLQLVIVHRSAIVGVGQAEVPDLGSLIEIRQAWRCDLEQGLGKRVENSGGRDPGLERNEVVEKRFAGRAVEQRVEKAVKGGFVLGVRD